MNYEVLDLGLVYYKDAIVNPQKIIDVVEALDASERFEDSVVQPWSAWKYGETVFNWQKFFPRPDFISPNDPYAAEMKEITAQLWGCLDAAFEHYTTQLYPFAKGNIKSEEHEMHLLKYERSGHLPAHQDQGVSSRVLSTVMYLNDNYDGGEIEFRQSNVKIKPEAGSIIFFPSNFLYVHEVYPINSGIRYSIPHWYHNIKNLRNSTGEE